jgi:hypothetical protein
MDALRALQHQCNPTTFDYTISLVQQLFSTNYSATKNPAGVSDTIDRVWTDLEKAVDESKYSFRISTVFACLPPAYKDFKRSLGTDFSLKAKTYEDWITFKTKLIDFWGSEIQSKPGGAKIGKGEERIGGKRGGRGGGQQGGDRNVRTRLTDRMGDQVLGVNDLKKKQRNDEKAKRAAHSSCWACGKTGHQISDCNDQTAKKKFNDKKAATQAKAGKSGKPGEHGTDRKKKTPGVHNVVITELEDGESS